MRGLAFSMAVIMALAGSGCAKQSPSLARVEGSEPQRLAFGPPKGVQQVFLEKMKLCWLATPNGILAGYRYDVTPAIRESSDAPLDQITLLNTTSRGLEAFAVEFHAFNENTLIATRNRGFPQPLAAQLRRDVESWIFERPGCDAISDPIAGAPPPDSSLKAPPSGPGPSYNSALNR